MTASVDEKASARAALARIRVMRALRWTSMLRRGLSCVALVLPGLACVGLFALVIATTDARAFDSPLALSLLLIVMFGGIAMAVMAMPLGMMVLLKAALMIAMLPYYAVVGYFASKRRAARDEAEHILDRDGVVPAAWAKGNKRRFEAIVELDRADAWLEHREGALVARVVGPGRVCSHCQGASRPVGEGVWRCEHCNREAFAKLEDAVEVAAARKKLTDVTEGKSLPRTRREMWKMFLAEHGEYFRTVRRRLLKTMVFYFGCAVIAEIGDRAGNNVVATLPLMGMCLSVLVLLYYLSVTCFAYFYLRFQEFGPGADSYDRALLGEIVACVVVQGRIKREGLAERLSISAEHLDVVLARFDALGGVPLLRDRKRDELVSLCAVEIGDRACPACGGELSPVQHGAIACGHCQVKLVLGSGHVAPHGALA